MTLIFLLLFAIPPPCNPLFGICDEGAVLSFTYLPFVTYP